MLKSYVHSLPCAFVNYNQVKINIFLRFRPVAITVDFVSFWRAAIQRDLFTLGQSYLSFHVLKRLCPPLKGAASMGMLKGEDRVPFG
jgi:hypothetical protein